jgi:hypothetical protein
VTPLGREGRSACNGQAYEYAGPILKGKGRSRLWRAGPKPCTMRSWGHSTVGLSGARLCPVPNLPTIGRNLTMAVTSHLRSGFCMRFVSLERRGVAWRRGSTVAWWPTAAARWLRAQQKVRW